MIEEYKGEFGLLGSDEQWAQAKHDNEERLAQERKRAAEDTEDAAKLQYDLDRLDEMALHFLREDLEKERPRVTPRQHKDYAAYRAYARDHGWPHDAPQTLFAFLAKNLSKPARVMRLHNSIQAFLQSAGLKDLTTDPIIRAILRRARKNKTNPPSQRKDEN